MATVNIGNLTFTHKGDYASGTQYVKNDVVYYSTNGNAYIAKQTTTGNAPTNGTYWSQFAAGSGGIWNAGLSLGSANQVVAVNSSANALEFQNAASGGVVQVKIMTPSNSSPSTTSTSFTDTGFSVSITPTSSSNRVLLYYQSTNQGSGNRTFYTFKREGHPSSNGDLNSILHSNNDGMLSSENINSNGNDMVTMLFIDNPQTTSALTYKFRYRNGNGSQTYLNNGGTFAYFIAMELDGGLF